MPRAIWSGSISFGLLNVPVKLYRAVSKKSVSLPRAARVRRLPGPPQARRRGRRRGGPLRRHRQGLRDRPRAVRGDHQGRARGARPEEDAGDRDPGLRRPRRDRPDLLRPPLLPRPRQGRRDAPTRCWSRRWSEQHKVAVARFVLRNKREPRRDPADGRRADDGDDAVRRRGGLARRDLRGARRGGRGAAARRSSTWPSADRLAHLRLRRRPVPRRVPRGAAGADRAQGQGRGASSAPRPRRRSRPRRPT